MKHIFKVTIAMLLAISLCMSNLLGVVALEIGTKQNENTASSAESALIIDKTATPLDQLYQTDVTLSVPGTIEADIDIVLLLGGGMQANKETVYSAINLFKPLMESGKSTVKLGLISLERGEEIIIDLADDEAVLDPDTYEDLIEEKFEYISSLPVGSTNLHSQLVEAKRMLDADTDVDADNKYLFVIATGRTYYFDDVNGNQATIVNKTTVSGTDYYYYGNYLWQSQRGPHTSLYLIPARYNNNWDAYWADVCKWVEADGDKYVYTLPIDKDDNASFKTWSDNNSKEIKELAGSSSRFGLGIVNPAPTAEDFVNGEINAIGDGNNPQHALNYERAQYESAKAYQALVDEGYNCYAICSETAYYQNNSAYIAYRNYTGSSTMQLGHSFMNYLASLSGQEEAPTVWDFARDDEGNPILFDEDEVLQEDFFTPIEEDILYTCSIGSTVEDYIGYDPEIGNFEFITDPTTITLTVSGNPYFTTQIETKEGFNASYAFSKEEGGEPTFWLDYDYGNGTTTEKFIWTFGENVSLDNKASLTYKLQLTDMAEEEGIYKIDTNLSATLYPKDSDGNDRDPIPFPVPNVEYEVVDTVYDGPESHDKSKTATDLYNNRYTDVTLSIPGEAETLSSDIVFVVDKSSSDVWAGGEAAVLFDQLLNLQEETGALIKIGLVVFDFTSHPYQDGEGNYLTTLKDGLSKDLSEFIESFSSGHVNYTGGTNADAGLTVAKEILDSDDKIDASRKHVVFICDGLTWLFYKDSDPNVIGGGTPYNILVKTSDTAIYGDYGIGCWADHRPGTGYNVPDNYTWDEYWAQIKAWVDADGDDYIFDYSAYKNSQINSEEAFNSAIPKSEVDQHALNMDRGMYEAWESYEALKSAGYNCYAINTQKTKTYVGYHFMTMLNGGKKLVLDDMMDTVFYSVSKGSTVVDYIGYSDDAKEGYDFDFIDEINGAAKLPVLKVGDKVYFTTKLATPIDGATASYVFSATENGEPTFAMDYYRGNGTTEEHFVWTINENVSRFAPVSLTYTLDLVDRSEIPGIHVDVDTNQKATLNPKDSDGNDGPPEDFEKPKVKYEVDPTEITITKIWNDDSNRDGKRPETITIRLHDDTNAEVAFVTLNAADFQGNEWSYTFEGLREYRDGKKIEYRITEDMVEGYTTVIDGFDVTNTYTPEKTQVSGSKIWNDANNQDGIRPESITINLLADGQKVDFKVVTADDSWSWSFTDLDKFANGQQIVYTITEDAVEGYTSSITGSVESGYSVVNTHIPSAKVSLEGIKYMDNEAASGFEFQLILSDGTVLETVVSDENGKFVFGTLVFDQEGTYRYTVKEVLGTDDTILYDETVYAVTIEVKLEDGQLKATVSLQKDDLDYEGQIEFYNESLTQIPDEEIPEAGPEENPKTGDSLNSVYAIMVTSGVLVIADVAFFKKRRFCKKG